MLRTEDKYLISYEEYILLRQRLNQILQHDNNNPNQHYKISSVYFDDINNSDYWSSVYGNPIRSKFRVRMYDDNPSLIKFEKKTKIYNQCKKDSCRISQEQLRHLLNGENDLLFANEKDGQQLFLIFRRRALVPKVIVSYMREAFVYPTGNVRITFDMDMMYSSHCESFGVSNENYYYADDKGIVMEVKYDQFMPNFLINILELGHFNAVSNSKYCICRELAGRRIL